VKPAAMDPEFALLTQRFPLESLMNRHDMETAMDSEKLEFFRCLLQEEMRLLLEEAGKTVSEMTADNTNFPDPNDRATQECDRTFELRIRDRERRLINKIREALQRIDEGSFGTCEVCGDEITEARLKARPVTTLCIDCKIEQEKKEKLL
jgi:DnaK suppressor protein